MSRPQLIAVALLASAVLHVALLLAPGRQLRLPISDETLVEVEIAPAPAEPEPAQLPPPPEPAPAPAPPPALQPLPLTADAAVALEQTLSPPGPSVQPPATEPAPLQLPSRALELPSADTIRWAPMPVRPEEPLPPGRAYLPVAELPPGPNPEPARGIADSLLRDLVAAPPPASPPALVPPQLEIEGPVGAEREVLSRPSPPSVAIHHSADVRLKFFVSPRGEVVQAYPLERGDAELDRAALDYLKKFRFNALPHDDQRVQWGTIRVRFRLE